MPQTMLVNYHTHTPRCHHAEGSEREYVEKAIQEGIQVLGFSDHTPYLFDQGFPYPNNRMRPEEFEHYHRTIRDLQREYASQITLLCGVEIEYYPGAFERTVRFLAKHDCDYLVLGQHFVGVEETPTYGQSSQHVFERYVEQCLQGLESGLISIFCHPDFCGYAADQAIAEKGYRRLFEAAKRMQVPLEINLQGLAQGRHYPTEPVFRLAREIGNEVVLGLDVHQTHRMADQNEIRLGYAFAASCGLTPVELTPAQMLLRKPLMKNV